MTFEEFIREWRNDEVYIKAMTSGSTGRPKEIKLSKQFVVESARRTNDFFDISSSSHIHSCLGADFIGGKMMAVRSEISKGKLTWEKPSNEPMKQLDRKEILDLVAVVPSQMIFILENLKKLPKIKNIIIGGSPIHPELRKKIAVSGLNAYETYGMTETASHIALRKIEEEENPFMLLPEIKISKNEEGCLKIKFENGIEIITNDIVELINEKQFFIKGRRDEMIISGGKKINPIEIERRISHLIGKPFIITGFPDEKWGEKIILLIEGEEEGSELSENLGKVLKRWEMPKEIKYLKTLPRTANGKIKRIKSL